jgi:hypothetical protein
MKKINFYSLLFAFIMLAQISTKAQDIHFSQFFEAPLLRNPSLAGIFTGDIRVQAVFRDQWNSVTNAYKTGSLNAEYKMPVGKGDDFLTTGIQILYDQAGTVAWKSTHILPALNYHKSLSDQTNRYLSLGFMGQGKIVIADIGHYETEQYTAELFQDILLKKFPTFAVLKTEVNTNPIKYFT